jgi:hypothetical protein
MRINAPIKEGYLPGFQYQQEKVGPMLDQVESYAIAPPEVLFLYHTWARLLKSEIALRSFSFGELQSFLRYVPEWLPANWPEAPASYRNLVAKLATITEADRLKAIPALPADVQIAITGWKNYFQEGGIIDKTTLTYQQLANFLERYPYYARNYWRNIVMEGRPHYLEKFTQGGYQLDGVVPNEELTAFLKVAFYNDLQSQSRD